MDRRELAQNSCQALIANLRYLDVGGERAASMTRFPHDWSDVAPGFVIATSVISDWLVLALGGTK